MDPSILLFMTVLASIGLLVFAIIRALYGLTRSTPATFPFVPVGPRYNPEHVVTIYYREGRGKFSWRQVAPEAIFFHEQWFLQVWDVDQQTRHRLAAQDVLAWYPGARQGGDLSRMRMNTSAVPVPISSVITS